MTNPRSKVPLEEDTSGTSSLDDEVRSVPPEQSYSPTRLTRSLPVASGRIQKRTTPVKQSTKQLNLLDTLKKLPENEKRQVGLQRIPEQRNEMTTDTGFKIDFYKGDRASLEPFLTLCDLTFSLNQQKYDRNNKKVIFVGGHFREGPLY